MGITERVESMVVRVSSPSGSVSAQLQGRNDVQVFFAPGYYHRTDQHDLESQLTQVAKLLWAARMREYQYIILDEYREQAVLEAKPVSRQDFEFYERRDALVAEGQAASGRIQLSVRGMRDWKVRISADVLRDMREDEFAGALGVAARELIGDQLDKVRELKVQTYDPDFVRDYKEPMA
jgi:hypothetical protein